MVDENETTGIISKNIPELVSTPLREDLIATAVKFLQNPKVQSSPIQQKRDFMKKKGLTEEEIQKAVKLSGVSDNTAPVLNQRAIASLPAQPSPPVSGWMRLRDYSSMTILIAGIVYGIYTLYTKYIEPIFLRRHKDQEEKLERMEKGIAELNSGVNKNLQELQSSMSALRDQLTDQSIKLASILDHKDSASTGGSSSKINAIQSELTSVKALLLGTKQFPSTPAIPPVIPSWQMKSKGTDPASATSLQRSLLVSSNLTSQNDSNFGSPALPKTISKSDLEHESGDEESNLSSDELSREVTVNGSLDSLSSSGKFSSNEKNSVENLDHTDVLLNSEKLPIGSPNQSLFEIPPETRKGFGDSEVD